MSQVVLGQMGLLGPGTDATLIDHIEDNLILDLELTMPSDHI